jgi:hypothetical protein
MLALAAALMAVPHAGAQDADLPSSVLVYVPFDGTTDADLGPGGGVRARFSRDSIAYDSAFHQHPPDEPRWVPGKLGIGLFLESGDYGDMSRGMQNWLPQATAEGKPEGFSPLGDAILGGGAPLVGESSVQVRAPAAGAGIETPPVAMAMILRHIGSAYLRGEAGGEKVELLMEDRTNGIASQPAEVELTTDWQRAFAVLPYDLDMKEFEGKPLEKSEDLRLVIRSASPEPVTFYVDALQLEQAGRFYSARFSPTSWVPGMTRRATELFSVPLSEQSFDPISGAVALWVRPSEMVSVKRFFQVNQYWDQPFALGARSDGKVEFAARGQKAASQATVEPNQWTHLALCWDENGGVLYVNGEEAGRTPPGDVDAEAILRGNWRMTVGSSHRAPITCADGAVDEFATFDRPLTAGEVRWLAQRTEALPLARDLVLQWDNPVRCLGRDLPEYDLHLRLLNRTDAAARGLAVSMEVAPLAAVSATVDVGATSAAAVTLPIQPCRLRIGEYEARVTWQAPGREPETATYPLTIGPFKDHAQFNVIAWYGGERDVQRKLKAAGVTVVDTGGGLPLIDIAAEEGLFGFSHLRGPHGFPRPGHREDRVVRCDGSPGSLNVRNAEVLAAAKEQAADYAREMEPCPNFVASIINTEWSSELDFSEAARAEVERRFGIDMKPWMVPQDKAWNIVLPFNRLSPTLLGDDWRPPGGVAPEDDPLLRFTEAWHKGYGSEIPLNESMVEAIHEVRPDVLCILEPILRCPPVVRYHKAGIAEEWVYYQDPKNMIPVQESLSGICRGLATRPSGMPQFLFKPGTAAPYAATPPPEMVREAVWLCCSRPIELMTFWGWHRVLTSDKMMTLEELEKELEGLDEEAAWEKGKQMGEGGGLFIPEVADEMGVLGETLWKPYGRLVKSWRNRPRQVAVILSLAASLYSNERWWTGAWLQKALTATGVPYDVLYDDAFAQSAVLAPYQVVVLPNTPAVTAREADALRRFIDGGGLVLADENCGVEIPGIVRLTEGLPDEADNLLARHLSEKLRLEVRCETPDVVYNVLEAEGASYLVAVNDKRVFGKYLGRWKRVWERGLPQRASFTVARNLGEWVAALTPDADLSCDTDGDTWRIAFDLPPCGGQIIGLFPREPGPLTVTVNSEPARGKGATVRIAQENGSGLMPIRIDIAEPDGSPSDLSRYGLLRNGELDLTLPIAVNDLTGEWTVRVVELPRDQVAERQFTVQ